MSSNYPGVFPPSHDFTNYPGIDYPSTGPQYTSQEFYLLRKRVELLERKLLAIKGIL